MLNLSPASLAPLEAEGRNTYQLFLCVLCKKSIFTGATVSVAAYAKQNAGY
jgi:hypothetical protein